MKIPETMNAMVMVKTRHLLVYKRIAVLVASGHKVLIKDLMILNLLSACLIIALAY